MTKVAVASSAVFFSDFIEQRNNACMKNIKLQCIHNFAISWLKEHPTFVPETYFQYSVISFGLSDDEIRQIPYPRDVLERFRVRLEFDTASLINEILAGTVGISSVIAVHKIATSISKLSRMELVFFKPKSKIEYLIQQYLLTQMDIGPFRTLPANATNAITYNNIKKGNKMVNFKRDNTRLESDLHQYYKASTYDALEINENTNLRRNPMTREPIEDVYEYEVA